MILLIAAVPLLFFARLHAEGPDDLYLFACGRLPEHERREPAADAAQFLEDPAGEYPGPE